MLIVFKLRMKLKLLNNEIYRDRFVSLINTKCRMLPGLDSERCSECPKQDSEVAQNGTR